MTKSYLLSSLLFLGCGGLMLVGYSTSLISTPSFLSTPTQTVQSPTPPITPLTSPGTYYPKRFFLPVPKGWGHDEAFIRPPSKHYKDGSRFYLPVPERFQEPPQSPQPPPRAIPPLRTL